MSNAIQFAFRSTAGIWATGFMAALSMGLLEIWQGASAQSLLPFIAGMLTPLPFVTMFRIVWPDKDPGEIKQALLTAFVIVALATGPIWLAVFLKQVFGPLNIFC